MKKKILIVDDDPEIIKLMEFTLRKWGYDTTASNDGFEGLSKSDEEKPDLVLLDIMMPGLDGMSVCSEITTSLEIPVIMVSALNDKATVDDSMVFGAADYVTKPINTEDLKSKIEKALKSH